MHGSGSGSDSGSGGTPPVGEGGAAGEEHSSWMGRLLSGSSSTLALAFLCNKALFPIRTPITLALTPAVAR